nr:UDP-N-acetylmuramate dehydrogenase [Thiospirillum jenense]
MLRGRLRRRHRLAHHTTWRVGGPADWFYRPADRVDLIGFLRSQAPDQPLVWLGLGSNVLIADAGFAGTVIYTPGSLTELILDTTSGVVTVEAGVTGSKLARTTAGAGWSGLEFLAGIPGTVGGALALNAGAWGQETWQHLRRVWTVDRAGVVRERDRSDYRVGYRHVELCADNGGTEWFLAAEFALIAADPAVLTTRIKELLARRRASQPTGLPSAGSVFRNPPGDYAGRLIEAAGLKGLRCGEAQVSTQHANFIIHYGQASASDIIQLIQQIQRKVAEQYHVLLQLEVHVIGACHHDEF